MSYAKPNEPYIHVDYRKEVYEFLKFIYKDEKIKVNGKEVNLPITAVYPKNFDNLPCITYNIVNEKSSKDNLNDQFFPNPINDPNDKIFNYTPDEWNKMQVEKNTEVVPVENILEIISKYTPNEWNQMMEVYRATGEKLWEETSTVSEENIVALADENNNEETPTEPEVPSVPSTPIEFPYKPYYPLIYAELEYQVDFWDKSLSNIIRLIRKMDEYIIHGPARFTKTFTSSDLYESDTKIYHKIIRYKALVDNHGNIFKGW